MIKSVLVFGVSVFKKGNELPMTKSPHSYVVHYFHYCVNNMINIQDIFAEDLLLYNTSHKNHLLES